MAQAIGDVLPLAIGVAFSPIPLVAVILMLFSPRSLQTGPAFAIGWAVGLIVTVGIVLALADPVDLADAEDNPSSVSGGVHLLLGVGLVVFALRQWHKRPKEGESPELPKWMRSIDKITPLVAFALGAFMGGISPKNLIFDIAAGTSIAQADLSVGNQIVVTLFFAVIASLSVAGVVIWYVLAKDTAEVKLREVESWTARNNATVMALLMFVLGVAQVGKGIGGIFS